MCSGNGLKEKVNLLKLDYPCEFPGDPGSGLHDFTAKKPGSVPGWGTKIPQAEWHWAKKKNGIPMHRFHCMLETQ